MEVSISEVLPEADSIANFFLTLDNHYGSGRLESYEGAEYLVDAGVRCSSAARALSIDEVIVGCDLVNHGITPGLIAGWNTKAFQVVESGDQVVSVNGVRGESATLKEELRAQRMLTVEVSCKNRRTGAGEPKVTKLAGLSESDTVATLKQKAAQDRMGASDLLVLSMDGKKLQDEVPLSTLVGFGLGSKQLHLADLAPLRPSSGCSIPEAEHRGIKLEQLKDLITFLRGRCRPDGTLVNWRSVASGSFGEQGNPLMLEALDFYQVSNWIIDPITKACSCSYVEVVAKTAEAQSPCWLASHTWAEPLPRLVACLECHARTRAQPLSTAYWIAAFADSQPLDSSSSRSLRDLAFARALERCSGALLVFGEGPTPLDRLWCCTEEFVATTKADCEVPLLLDYGATHQRGSTILTDGLAPLDGPGGSAWMWKSIREADFPISLVVQAAINAKLETAESNSAAQRSSLLGAVAGTGSPVADPGSNAAVLKAGQRLRAGMAAALWRRAVEEGIGLSDDRQLMGASLRECSEMQNLSMNFGGCSNSFLDDHLSELAVALPPSLLQLSLGFYACMQITDVGLSKLASGLPSTLSALKLDFWWCRDITNWGVRSLAMGLPVNLKHLTLSFEECQFLGNEGVVWLSERLPTALKSLSLNFWNCTRIDDRGVAQLADDLPSGLERLDLTFCRVSELQEQSGVSEITDKGLMKLCQSLPPGLVELSIRFVYCQGITDDAVEVLARSLPKGLAQLTLDFRGCKRISNESQKTIESLEIRRPVDRQQSTIQKDQKPDQKAALSKLTSTNGHGQKAPTENAKKVIGMFHKVDSSKKGTISRSNLLYLLQVMYPTLSITQFDLLVAAAGMSMDDVISYEKFIVWLCSD